MSESVLPRLAAHPAYHHGQVEKSGQVVEVAVWQPWVARRWPKRRSLLPSGLFFVFAVSLILGVIVFNAWTGTTRAWIRGNNTGYAVGQHDGRQALCARLYQQARYANNVEVALYNSGHDSLETYNAVIAADDAAFHDTCDPQVVVSPNLYDPSTKTPSLPLQKTPTLPISRVKTGNAQILMSHQRVYGP